MANGGGTTNTQIHKTLRRILDLLKSLEDSFALYVGPASVSTPVNLAAVVSGLASIDSNTDGIEALITAANAILATIDSDTGNIINSRLLDGGNTNAFWVHQVSDHLRSSGTDNIHTLLDDLIALITTGNASLVTIDADTDDLSGIKSDTQAIQVALEGDIQAELESIDQNWNLLSLNQLNLAAILTAVLNNATSGNQTTIIGHLDGVEGLLGDIKTDLDQVKQDLNDLTPAGEAYWSELNLDTGSPTETDIVAAGKVVRFEGISATSDDTTSRVVTITAERGASSVELTHFTISSALSPKHMDDLWSETAALKGMCFDDQMEIKASAPAVTAGKEIIVNVLWSIVRITT